MVDSNLTNSKVDTALSKTYELSNHQNRDTDEQKWKDFFNSSLFSDVRTDTLFMDGLLAYLTENRLEDWIIKDLCRAYEMKKLVETSQLLGKHRLYFYLADIREDLLNNTKIGESKTVISIFAEAVIGMWSYLQIMFLVLILILSPLSLVRWLYVAFITTFYETPALIAVLILNCAALLYSFIRRRKKRKMFIRNIVLFILYSVMFVIFVFTTPDFF